MATMPTIADDNEILAASVRNYPVLYDRNCKNFKNKWAKSLAWEEVAKDTGLVNADAARIAFYNLRTRFARNLKKRRTPETADQEEELFPFLSWLETHIKSRKAIGNTSSTKFDDYGNEDSDIEDTPVVNNHEESLPASKPNFNNDSFIRPKKNKARLLKAKARLNQEIASGPPELHVLQSIGASFGRKTQANDITKYEDEIFGAFVISQLRHIPNNKKTLLKMQISNMLYKEVLAAMPSDNSSVNHIVSSQPPTVSHTPTATSATQLPLTHTTTVLPRETHPPQPMVTSPQTEELLQAAVTLPSSAQQIEAVTLPLSAQPVQDSLHYTPMLSQVTVTLPHTVQPVQATLPQETHTRQDVNLTWSRLQPQQQRQRNGNS